MEFFTAMAIVFGIGACDGSVDYCPEPIGKFAIELTVANKNSHSIVLNAEHYSEVGNGEPFRGDRGTEFYMLEYKYRLF